MLAPSVDKLFERYRRRGDAAALAKVFDATAPELFRLAQHLVRDPLEAEDVLQETFVTAIDAAERWDSARPLVPWLTGILARKASEARRRARRSLEPERLTERAEEDPAELAADSELSRAILEAIDALPELYRAVLRRHLLDGSKPAEIARDLGRAPGTVRMQLHRGLEQLRKSLPASFAAGAALSALAPRGLSAVREAVLAHAASVGVAAGVGVPIAAKTATFALGKLLGAVALGVAVALAVVLTWTSSSTERPRSPELAGPSLERAAGGNSDLRSVSVAEGDARAPNPEAPRPWRRSRIYLVGHVLGPAPDEMADVRLEVRGVARYDWPRDVVAAGAPERDGSFEVLLDPLFAHAARVGRMDELALTANHAAYVPAEVRFRLVVARIEERGSPRMRALLESDIELARAAILRGVVRRPAGSSASLFAAALPWRDGVPQSRVLDTVEVSGDGSYALRVGEPGEIEVAVAGADALAASARVYAAVGQESVVPDLLLEKGARLEGRWRNGAARVPFEQVRAQRPTSGSAKAWIQLGGRTFAWEAGTWATSSAFARLDDEGAFAFDGLEPGMWALEPAGTLSQPALLAELTPAQMIEVSVAVERVELDLGCGYAGVQVLDESGAPRSCEVAVRLAEDPALQPLALLATSPIGELAVAAPSGRALHFEVQGANSVAFARSVISPAAGELTLLELRVPSARAPASAELTLSGPGGPLEGEVNVVIEPAGGRGFETIRRKVEVNAGGLTLEDLPAAPLRVELFVGGAYKHYQGHWLPLLVDLDLTDRSRAVGSLHLEPGGRLRISARDRAGVLLGATCRVRDLYGAEVPVRFLLRSPDEQGFVPGGRLSERGPSDVYPNLAPGAFELELDMEGREPRAIAVQVRAGEVTAVEVELP